MTKSRAGWTCALRTVETKESGLQFFKRAFGVVRAGEFLAVAVFSPRASGVFHQHQDVAFAQFQRGFHAFCNALAIFFARHHAVNDGFNGVRLVAAEREGIFAASFERLADIKNSAVHARAHEPLLGKRLQHIFVEALLAAHHRRAQHEPRAFSSKNRINNLRWRSGANRLAADAPLLISVPTRGRSAAREHQAQVVIDFRGGGNGGTRRVTATALLDGDGWRQTLNRVHIRLLHLVQELARIRGEALHVLALTFSKDGVERQRALAAAADAGHHHQAVARDGDVHALEVVLTRPANTDGTEVSGLWLCAGHGGP